MKHLLAAALLCLSAAPALADENPWNGAWTLDAGRSTPGIKDQAAPGYVFTLQPDGQIRWEIPAIGEVVTGRTDGEPRPGMTLAVQTDGPRVMTYKVAIMGKPEGEGRMTLVENGKAWVDISWPAGKPEYAGALVYVRP